MYYQESPPSLRFADLVKCFWSLEYQNRGVGEPEPVVPDGCIEIVFNLADRFRRYSGGECETQPASLIAGQMRECVLIAPIGDVRLFGIRFHNHGAFPFFRFDPSELENRIEQLDSIWGNSVRGIEDRLASAQHFEDRIAVAEEELGKRMIEKAGIDPFLRKAVYAISQNSGNLRVADIVRDVGISERSLERSFKRRIGLSPKAFSRIVRFQSVLRSIESSTESGFLDRALAFGYYDQSHLINDFRQFAGTTPASFVERSRGMTEMFIFCE